MEKFFKSSLITAGILCVSSVLAAPQISTSNTYIGSNVAVSLGQQKTVIIKPVGVELNAASWVAMNYVTGAVVSEKDANERRAPASLAKIMTAYIVANEIKNGSLTMEELVPISVDAANTGGSRMFIKSGDKISVENLLQGVIVDSGNDATIALAEYLAGSDENFTTIMNQTAQALGMANTKFDNPDGLPGGEQYTTAYDMAILARSFIYNFPDVYKIYSQKTFTWEEITQHNRNKLLNSFPGADGMKTGYTKEAGYNLVSSALQDGDRYIGVILGSPSVAAREQESIKLLRYANSRFENTTLYIAGKPVLLDGVNIKKAKKGQTLSVVGSETIIKTLPRTYIAHLKQGVELNDNLKAPIKKGQAVGKLVVTLDDGEIIASTPVVANNNIKDSWW